MKSSYINTCLIRVKKTAKNARQFSTDIEHLFQPKSLPTISHNQFDIDNRVSKAIEEGSLKPRKHPGVFRSPAQALPENLIKAIDSELDGQNKKNIAENAKLLCKFLYTRKTPPEDEEFVMRSQFERMRLELRRPAEFSSLEESVQERILLKEEKIVKRRAEQSMSGWGPLNTGVETCAQYLVGRAPAEFSVLSKIFSEIMARDKDFAPRTLFDFGSGVGSGYWAAMEIWKKPFVEVFNVDSNVNMNELANNLLKQLKGDSTLGRVNFRQFLPAAPEPMYDLVLSAYSLLELPSLKDRMEALVKLWAKTKGYMVVVEQGSNAGYQAVMEARNLILVLENGKTKDVENIEDRVVEIGEKPQVTGAHVFAPCPHDLPCPRFFNEFRPCNFKVTYNSLPYLSNKQEQHQELFSYVVFKKGPRPVDDPRWARCVNETLCRGRHVITKACDPSGVIVDGVLTKMKSDRAAYRCARHTKWGDLLPGHFSLPVPEGESERVGSNDTMRSPSTKSTSEVNFD